MRFSPFLYGILLGFEILGLSHWMREARAQAAEFLPYPVDVSGDCNATIIKGTQRFKGTAFVLPSVFLSVNKNREKIFRIIPNADGSFLLQVGIYIPQNIQEAIEFRQGDSPYILHGCDYAAIRKAAFQQFKTGEGDGPILTLSMLPVRELEVSISGLDDKVLIGDMHTFVQFLGMDTLAEFKIPNARALDLLLNRLRKGVGLNINVRFSFLTKKTESFLSVDIDTKKLKSRLNASFRGKTKILAVDLRLQLEKYISNEHKDIYQEGGDQALTDLAFELMRDGLGAESGEGAEAENSNAEGEPDRPIEISAFYSRLEERKTLHLQYQKMGAQDEKVSYLTSTIAELDMNNLRKVRSDQRPVTFSEDIRAGDRIEFSIESVSRDRFLRYDIETQRFLNRAEVLSLKRDYAARLTDERDYGALPVLFGARESSIVSNASGVGLYVRKPGILETIGGLRITAWELQTRKPIYSLGREKPFSIDDPREIEGIPLKIRFSRFGRSFSLGALISETVLRGQVSPYFTLDFNEALGKFSLLAKQDLGFVSFYNHEFSAEGETSDRSGLITVYSEVTNGKRSDATSWSPYSAFNVEKDISIYTVKMGRTSNHPQKMNLNVDMK